MIFLKKILGNTNDSKVYSYIEKRVKFIDFFMLNLLENIPIVKTLTMSRRTF